MRKINHSDYDISYVEYESNHAEIIGYLESISRDYDVKERHIRKNKLKIIYVMKKNQYEQHSST